MSLQSIGMALVENTWMVSMATAKYLLTGLVLINLYRHQVHGAKELFNIMRQAADYLPLEFKEHIVYGMVASGIIASVTNTTVGVVAASGVTVYILYKSLKSDIRDPRGSEGIADSLGYIIQIFAVLSGVAALLLGWEILNSITALYIFLVIFWKI